MIELVEYIIKNLADKPDSFIVTEENSDSAVTIVVKAPADEMGRVIGKQGRIAKAIRTIVKAASPKNGKKYLVEIKDKE